MSAVFGKLKKYISKLLVDIIVYSSQETTRILYPSGLFTKPKNSKVLLLQADKNTERIAFLVAETPSDLGFDDLLLTNNTQKIHFKAQEGELHITANKIVLNGVVMHNNKTIDSTHTHKYIEPVADKAKGPAETEGVS